MAVELGRGGADAIGDERKQCAFKIEAETARCLLLPDDAIDAQALPDRFKNVDIAIRPSTDKLPVISGGDDFFRRTTAQDAACETAKLLRRLGVVGATTVEDDVRLGTSLVGVPNVLGQLQVDDNATVGPLLFAFSEVHGPPMVRRNDRKYQPSV